MNLLHILHRFKAALFIIAVLWTSFLFRSHLVRLPIFTSEDLQPYEPLFEGESPPQETELYESLFEGESPPQETEPYEPLFEGESPPQETELDTLKIHESRCHLFAASEEASEEFLEKIRDREEPLPLIHGQRSFTRKIIKKHTPTSNQKDIPENIPIPPVITSSVGHAMLSIITWGIMIPAAAFFQRHRRFFYKPDQLAANYHVVLHGALECLAILGVVIDWAMCIQTIHLASHPHCLLSVFLYIAVLTQISLAFFLRPDRGGNIRKIIHRDLGLFIVFAGIVNALEGIHRHNVSSTSRGVYLLFIVVAFVASKVLDNLPNRLAGERAAGERAD